MSKWVSVWGNAVSPLENKPESYAKNITLRYPILIALDGDAIRLTFDNFAGTEAISLTKVTVAKYDNEKQVLMDDIYPVFFNGQTSVKIPEKQNVVSDVVDMEVKKGETIAVSFYLGDYTLMKNGVMTWGPLSKAYYSIGNVTEERSLIPANTRAIGNFYFLNQIDVLTDDKCSSVICYGDSITAQSWPEYLQLKLMENNKSVGIVRRGVSGARVLREYHCLDYEHYGIKGSTRFEHEAHACGADTVVILQGINDLIHPIGEDVNPYRPWSDLPTSVELIDGLRGFVKQAKDDGLKVYLGTALPVKGWRTYADFRNTLREEVNEWIRTTDEIDGYIDFDLVMQDSEDSLQLNPALDSGDHLHPNEDGHKRMAEEVYKELNQ